MNITKVYNNPELALQLFFQSVTSFDATEVTEDEASNLAIDFHNQFKYFHQPVKVDLRKESADRKKLDAKLADARLQPLPKLRDKVSQVWLLDHYAILFQEMEGKVGVICCDNFSQHAVLSGFFFRYESQIQIHRYTSDVHVEAEALDQLIKGLCNMYIAFKNN